MINLLTHTPTTKQEHSSSSKYSQNSHNSSLYGRAMFFTGQMTF